MTLVRFSKQFLLRYFFRLCARTALNARGQAHTCLFGDAESIVLTTDAAREAVSTHINENNALRVVTAPATFRCTC